MRNSHQTPTKSPVHSDNPTKIILVEQSAEQGLTKEQKAFNTLTQKTEKLKAELAAWSDAQSHFQSHTQPKMVALEGEQHTYTVQLLEVLNAFWWEQKATKSEKKQISQAIVALLESMPAIENDQELQKLFNVHSGRDIASEIKAEQDDIKSEFAEYISEMFGEAFLEGLDDSVDPEAFLQQILGKLGDQQAEKMTKPSPQKSAKQKAAADKITDKKERAEKELSQSVRAIYRQLASSLHPDREPDETERTRKTELMKQVNTAYEANDLFALLHLQLENEQLDVTKLAEMSAEKIKHYNTILRRQNKELTQECQQFSHAFMRMFDFQINIKTPQALNVVMQREMIKVQEMIELLKQDIAKCRDWTGTKHWLKMMRG